MDWERWLRGNQARLGSQFEVLFVERVLSRIPDVGYQNLEAQMPFRDEDGNQRYCDFAIQEGNDLKIAIEIDGYDKTGSGQGMTHAQFVDWQRRHASLVAQGWNVIRFANRDVANEPERCAYYLQLLLRRERAKSQHGRNLNHMIESLKEEIRRKDLEADSSSHDLLPCRNDGRQKDDEPRKDVENDQSKENVLQRELYALQLQREFAREASVLSREEELELERFQEAQDKIRNLTKEGSVMKTTILALAAIIIAGMGLFAYQNQYPFSAMSSSESSAAASSAGVSCDNPLSWNTAKEHVGEVMAYSGPVISLSARQDVNGSPTWVNVGAGFPDRNRLSLVIWGSDRGKFETMLSEGIEGETVCAVGEVEMYEGVPQIELKERGQLVL